MARRPALKAELDQLREELEELRTAAGAKLGDAAAAARDAVEDHGGELKKLIDGYLKEAEETMAEHPLATVAGALVIGILIGRLTAR